MNKSKYVCETSGLDVLCGVTCRCRSSGPVHRLAWSLDFSRPSLRAWSGYLHALRLWQWATESVQSGLMLTASGKYVKIKKKLKTDYIKFLYEEFSIFLKISNAYSLGFFNLNHGKNILKDIKTFEEKYSFNNYT